MKPLVLAILDGWGHRPSKEGNAIALARTPNLDRIVLYPHTTLAAAGPAVGLPPGTIGNSEVGHLTIGAGRIVMQDYSRINQSIEDGSFAKNPVIGRACGSARESGKTLHLMGLLSDAGVHSHQDHLFALLKKARDEGVKQVAVHPFLDGRDTRPTSGLDYVKKLEAHLRTLGVGKIATVIGRYYPMDRDHRWERTQMAYEVLVEGRGSQQSDPTQAIREAYGRGETDEFLKPIVISRGERPLAAIQDGDVVLFYNFRADRARQLTRALTEEGFGDFPRRKVRLGLFVCMTEYDRRLKLPVAFPPQRPDRTLAEILSEQKIPQFHSAETEKYAHVTYFLNGGREEPFPGEERLLIPSPRDVPTYDQKPEMCAEAVTDLVLKKLRGGCPIVIVNYANPDMVGHSGNLPAAIRAVEVIDTCLGRLCEAVGEKKGTLVITADHGNCEEMQDAAGGPHTAHTTNPVPFYLVGEGWLKAALRPGGGLKDVAPTILKILEIPQPPEMTGESLIIRN